MSASLPPPVSLFQFHHTSAFCRGFCSHLLLPPWILNLFYIYNSESTVPSSRPSACFYLGAMNGKKNAVRQLDKATWCCNCWVYSPAVTWTLMHLPEDRHAHGIMKEGTDTHAAVTMCAFDGHTIASVTISKDIMLTGRLTWPARF